MKDRTVVRVEKALEWWENGEIRQPTPFAERKTGGRVKATDYLVPGDVLRSLILGSKEYLKNQK